MVFHCSWVLYAMVSAFSPDLFWISSESPLNLSDCLSHCSYHGCLDLPSVARCHVTLKERIGVRYA